MTMNTLRWSRWRGLRRLFLFFLAILWALSIVGCANDTDPDADDAIKGKTPVLRPEDVHGQGTGGAAILSPDYRQGLTADLDAVAAREGQSGKKNAASAAKTPLHPDTKETQTAATAINQGAAPGFVAGVKKGDNPAAGVVSGFPVAGCRQLVVVTARDMGATQGLVRRFERDGDKAPWREAGTPMPCALGRKGLAVGRGLEVGQPLAGPAKRQGDGRTPAGLFPLPVAFGSATPQSATAAGVQLPYVAVTDRTVCITEPGSPLLGRVVGPQQRPTTGGRQERMVRDDKANVWGVVIGHNQEPSDPDAGVCLFINVRAAGGAPTGGSIGLPEEMAGALVAWLHPAAMPLLAVLSEKDYQERMPGP